MNAKRIEWIDMAKGIAILLVIAGHSIGGVTRGIIFSFHMPLFFILSCMTFRFSEDDGEFARRTGKAFRHLFLPAAGIFACILINRLLQNIPVWTRYTLSDWKDCLAGIVCEFVAGSGVAMTIGDTTVKAIGIPWFLFALFFGRTLYDLLHLKCGKKGFYVMIGVCTALGVLLGRIQWLPFSFDIALAIQPFFLFATWFKNHGPEKKTAAKLGISFAVWAGSFLGIYLLKGTYLELACRNYTMFPLSYICAIAGTVFVSCISLLLVKIPVFARRLLFLGENSLIMLWIHSLDYIFERAYTLAGSVVLNMLIRVAEDVMIFAVVMTIIGLIRRRKIAEREKNT